MKILVLVMSARREPWGSLMDASMETWDSINHEQIQTLYYCGKGGQSTERIFYSERYSEDLEDVSQRTMEAFEKSLELPWDYLARPNSSCYVHKRNLAKFCEGLDRRNILYGVLSEGQIGKRFLWGGCQYILSRDVVEKLVANKERWNNSVMEDQAITFLAEELGIPTESKIWCASINMPSEAHGEAYNGMYLCLTYNHGENFTFTNWADINKASGHYFFRCKQDGRRNEDVRIFHELFRHFK